MDMDLNNNIAAVFKGLLKGLKRLLVNRSLQSGVENVITSLVGCALGRRAKAKSSRQKREAKERIEEGGRRKEEVEGITRT